MFVPLQILFEIFRIAVVYVEGEVVVYPSTVATDGETQFFVLANHILADGIVVDVETSLVAELHSIRTGCDVDRVWTLLEDSPVFHLLQRLDGGVGVNVPVERDASDTVGDRKQARQSECVFGKIIQESV